MKLYSLRLSHSKGYHSWLRVSFCRIWCENQTNKSYEQNQTQPNSPTSYSLTNGKAKKQVRSATKQDMGMVIEAYRSLISVCSVLNSPGARLLPVVCLGQRGTRMAAFGLDGGPYRVRQYFSGAGVILHAVQRDGRERRRAAEGGGELYERCFMILALLKPTPKTDRVSGMNEIDRNIEV